MPATETLNGLPGIASDIETARSAVIDAIASTAHITNLMANHPGMDEMRDAIILSLADPAVAWAIQGVITTLEIQRYRSQTK